MNKFLENVRECDFDRRISEVVEMLEEEQLYGTISLIKDLKYYLDLATKEKTHTCNCKRNSNSRDNESCCRCDSRQTNAERIRNMTDDELAEFLAYNAYCEECYVKKDDSCCYPDGTCKQKHLEWLQSEAE